MAVNIISILLVLLLAACTNQPPGCSGPVGMMNQGMWTSQMDARK